MSFPAKYPGTCGDCGQDFVRNTEVTYVGDLGVCHVKCPTAESVCPKCFMAIPSSAKECPDCD
jgi:hypothetical protein